MKARQDALSADVGVLESKADALSTDVGVIETKIDDAELENLPNLDVPVSSRASQDSVDTLTDNVAVIEGKVDTDLDVTVSSRATQSSVDAIEIKADYLQSTLTNEIYGLPEIKGEVAIIESKLPTGGIASQDSVDAIETKLDDPTFGLNAVFLFVQNNFNTVITKIDNIITIINIINGGVGAIEAKLDDPDTGLVEIKAEVSSIETKIDDDVADKDDVDIILDRLEALETKLDVIEAKLEAVPPRCGDNNVDPGEQCDDGNNLNGDGCSATCLLENCGNGRLDFGEQCDDGNNDNGDGCNRYCQTEQCLVDEDCPQGAVCNEDNICVGGEPVVVFRTNVENGQYFSCSPNNNCWIALDFDNDGDLDALGFSGKSSKCNNGALIVKTPEGYDVLDYGHSSRVRLCDSEGREIRFDLNEVPQDVELSKEPTEPYTSNNQETLVI